MFTDEIRIENLEVYAYHGVFSEENRLGQRFYVNTVLYTDTRGASATDDLTQSTDYGRVAHFIHDYLQKNTYKLIETAADRLATALLEEYRLIHHLELEIRKPDAPIGLTFGSVSVKITRGWSCACIAIGANVGDVTGAITAAINQIKSHRLMRAVRVSELLRSTPYGGIEQPDFVNGALVMETLLAPTDLLTFLQTLEEQAARVRTVHWGPRTLDLDILLYEGVILASAKLTIPHPDMHNRDFVLQPLAQLMPHLRHPLLNKTVNELLSGLNEPHIVE